MWQEFYKNKYIFAIILTIWVLSSMYFSSFLLGVIYSVVSTISPDIIPENEIVLYVVVYALGYLLNLAVIVAASKLIMGKNITLKSIGLDRLPTWIEVVIAPAGFVVYLIVSSVLMMAAQDIIPGFDINQAQETGFSSANTSSELLIAFVALVVIAPVAEEIIFRGYLFGKLKKVISIVPAIILVSLAFGFAHGAWNVGIDTFALSLVLCTLRYITGSIWPSIILHSIKNGVAFYFLFISSTLM